MASLGEEIPKEQIRVRELLSVYKSIGPGGAFGALMIEQVLQKADRAVMSGSVVEMIQVYEELKQCE